ncbi:MULTISPECIES: helix-turn-helix transcriptional regulator [unclassified Streptomyces]|uniref:helix-turn-helix transcriptional regulator n=1 Tax=unclassified Streptomyces TaxID=2593676 RepID=UPI003820446B
MTTVQAPVHPAQDPDERLTAREASALARVSEKTLANWRSLGIGPPYTKLSPGRGGRIRYRRCDVLAWLAEREVAA